jgi:hypothetical protein
MAAVWLTVNPDWILRLKKVKFKRKKVPGSANLAPSTNTVNIKQFILPILAFAFGLLVY